MQRLFGKFQQLEKKYPDEEVRDVTLFEWGAWLIINRHHILTEKLKNLIIIFTS